jgi:predicted transcriptional regulator
LVDYRQEDAVTDDRALTEGEADIMEALWSIGEGTVRDVLDALPAGRDLAYTSVATWLKILEIKAFVANKADGRRLVWWPLLSREAYRARSVRKLTQRWFGGNPLEVVRQLVDGEFSDDDLAELRRLVDEKLGGDS